MKRALRTAAFCILLHAGQVAMAQHSPSTDGVHAAQALPVQGDIAGAHDPSIIRSGHTWYVFTTGKAADGGQFGIRCSQDLTQWTSCGHVFDQVPAWIHERSPLTRDLWAPDISYEHGEYRLYYAYSVFGKNTSGIALATNKTLDVTSPDYHWQDKGMVLESKAADDFNAIDPNYVEDAHHHAWLDFGSFWSGIKMRELDPLTGKLLSRNTSLYSLASRSGDIASAKAASPAPSDTKPPNAPAAGAAPDALAATSLPADSQAIEAPFIFAHGGYYYLFVSFDLCCRGTRSTYRTMVGRASTITGPYLDRLGKPLLQGGGTELLTGNGRWLGPGGESVLAGAKGSPDLLVFHAYDGQTGRPSLQLSTIVWIDGWPQVKLSD